MEATIVYWDYIGTMEKMEATMVCWGYIGIMETKKQTIGIMKTRIICANCSSVSLTGIVQGSNV